MPKYLVEGAYTDDGLKGLIKDKASGRAAAVQKAAQSLGGTLDAIYYTFGETDLIVILDLPDNANPAAQEEIFGPVIGVLAYDDLDDAVRIANDSVYGLSGGVVSADLDRAMKIAERIRTGTISVNGGIPITGDLPFGGYKHSGIGREWGVEGIEEYLESKVLAYGVVA